MRFSEWMNNRTLGTDEVESQIDGLYDKAKYAVKLAQMYVKSSPDPQVRNLLKNISTIAPLNSGVYGLYNSAENRAIIGPPANKTRFTFGQDMVDGQEDIQKLPVAVIRKHMPEVNPSQIKPSDVIHVNVNQIVSKAGDSMRAVIEIASTIIHEAKHNQEYRSSQSPRPALGEANPVRAEEDFKRWVDANWARILSAIPQLKTLNFKNR